MPRVFQINLPQGVRRSSVRLQPEGWLPGATIRFGWQTRRDDQLFESRWLDGFRERWRKALRDARFAGPLAQYNPEPA